ncbi:MAG TPA: histidine kinase, partial [Anaerolineae bacterium]
MSLPFVRSSLRAKVTIGVVLPLVLILSIFTTIEYFRRRAVLLSNLSFFATYSAQVIEDNLLHQMLEADFAGVQQLLDTISEREEFQTVYILDTSGKVVFAPSGADVGMQLDNKQPDCQPCHRLPPEARPESVAVTNAAGQRVFRSMHPFEYRPACGQCHDPEERLIGLLLTDISTAPVEASLVADLRENALWWIGTILVTVLVVNLVISRFVLRRLQGLAWAIARFGQGTLPPLENGSDEIGQLTNSFSIMARRIEKRRQENRVLSERLRQQSVQRGELLRRLITAQEDERKRVARELHDDLGQTLGGLTLRVEVMGRFLKSDHSRAFEQLEQIQSLIAATTAQMYNIILDLRPSILDDLGLVPALRAYAERLLEHSDLQFELEAHTFRHRLPAEVETALFRVFQEALNNTVRHAGATCVRAVLTCQNNIFTGEIVDNGRGFDLESINLNGHSPRGLGLLGMQER